MTNNKFVLINLETKESTEYKTIKQISKALNLDYSSTRAIYINHKQNKHFNSDVKELSNQYKIIDKASQIKCVVKIDDSQSHFITF
jgi:hypothetical protein